MARRGYKPANKKGHYFWGHFDPKEHQSAESLRWMREKIDANICFWKMEPVALAESIFGNAPDGARTMHWPGRQYVLGTNKAHAGVIANLPPGNWKVMRFDVISRQEPALAGAHGGAYIFDSPPSRAVLFHFKADR